MSNAEKLVEGAQKKELSVSRCIFWDIGEERIPLAIVDNPDVCIPRIFERGSIEEIKAMIDYYGYDMAREVIKEQLSKRDLGLLNLACIIFQLEKKDFQCYRNKQFRHIY